MKKVNWKLLGVIVLASVLMAGCATTAHVEKGDNVNLNSYKSFSWLHTEGGKMEHRIELSESKIRAAVTKELEKNGWKEAKSKPDALVDYDILVERSNKERSSPVYSQPATRLIYNPYTRRYTTIHYPSRFMGYESYEEMIKEGTITITMIDAKTDKVIWQGWTTNQINSQNLTSKEIQRAVNSIFKKLDLAKN